MSNRGSKKVSGSESPASGRFGNGGLNIVNIRYYIDPETQIPHIYGHNVLESEVEEVLSDPGEDRIGRERSGESAESM